MFEGLAIGSLAVGKWNDDWETDDMTGSGHSFLLSDKPYT
jgi:hypothetical protein